jgi:hypothetical protein
MFRQQRMSAAASVWRAIVAGVTFPLEALCAAVTARVETRARLGMRWHTRPVQANYGKPVVGVEFESSAWLAGVRIWITGEAELETIRGSRWIPGRRAA